MSIHLCVHVCLRMICTHVYARMHLCMHTPMHILIRMSITVSTLMFAHLSALMSTRMSAPVSVKTRFGRACVYISIRKSTNMSVSRSYTLPRCMSIRVYLCMSIHMRANIVMAYVVMAYIVKAYTRVPMHVHTHASKHISYNNHIIITNML